MPGTDLCIKVGGWVRAEAVWGGNGSMTWGPFNGNANNRATSNEAMRARGYITADVRNQTEYGTVRGYIAVGLNTNDVGLQVASLVDSANRAFVQWAGMTAGLSQSFFDYYSVPAMQYRGGYLPASDTGDGGWWVWAYTAQFGGGVSATISTEARRTTQIINQTAAGATVGTAATGTVVPGGYISAVAGAGSLLPGAGAYGGQQAGDVVANLRIDQAWGGAQIMGAAHEVNANYYTSTVPGSGHPGDQWGWAAGVGFKINTPMISQGDWLQAQFNVTQGALRYLFNTPNSNWGKVSGANESYGVMSDCVYGGTVAGGNSTGCQLTSAWGFNAGYEHYWTPAVAHQLVRRLVPGEVQRRRQRDALRHRGQRHLVRFDRGRRRRLQQQLVDLGRRLAHAVGRDQDVLPRRGSAVREHAQRYALDHRHSRRHRVRRRDDPGGEPEQLDGQRSRSPRLPALIA